MNGIIICNLCSLCAMATDAVSGTRRKRGEILAVQVLNCVGGVGNIVVAATTAVSLLRGSTRERTGAGTGDRENQ